MGVADKNVTIEIELHRKGNTILTMVLGVYNVNSMIIQGIS